MTNIDVKEYWREIRQLAAKFDPAAFERDLREEDPANREHLKRSEAEVWLTSLDVRKSGSVGGMTLTMRPYRAAEVIFNGLYRLATDVEIDAERERLAIAKREIDAKELARKQTIHTTSEVKIDADSFAAAVAGAMRAERDAAKKRPDKPEGNQ